MKEIWKDIKGFEGLYQVSNLGRVKSLNYKRMKQEKLLILHKDRNGYLEVRLSKKEYKKMCLVHKLVAETFLDKNNFKSMPNENRNLIDLDKLQVNHIKEFEKTNNRVDNLEWCTRNYNSNYGSRNERISKMMKQIIIKIPKKINQYDLNGNFIKTWESVKQIKQELNYTKSCIYDICNNKRKNAYGYVWRYKDDISD